MHGNHASGFTLIEIIVVITLALVLAAITIPAYLAMGKQHHRSLCMDNLRVIGMDLAQYRQDYEVYPAAPLPSYLQTLNPAYLPMSELPFQPPARWIRTFDGEDDTDSPQLSGAYTGKDELNYIINITATGTPDVFRWSDDGGKTWRGTGLAVPVTQYPLSYGVNMQFGQNNGHATGDTWTFTAKHVTPKWPGGNAPAPVMLNSVAAAGASAVNITLPATVGARVGGTYALLAEEPTNNVHAEIVPIEMYSAGTLTFAAGFGLENAYSTAAIIDFRVGNYGLVTPFARYDRQKSAALKVKGAESFHCPAMFGTADINKGANLEALSTGLSATFRRFDPLWTGYNTYGITYNYDQYNSSIRDFDQAMGFSNTLNRNRQLKNPNPPADTVVCWCYGHQPSQDDAYTLPDNSDATTYAEWNWNQSSPGYMEEADFIQRIQRTRKNDLAIVLWVDGSVGMMRPTLSRRRDPDQTVSNPRRYYWVPPFLYAQGDARL